MRGSPALWRRCRVVSRKEPGCRRQRNGSPRTETSAMQFNAERVRDNVRQADTNDLLDRITVYRAGMEPEAVDIIESELFRRGLDGNAIAAHAEKRSGQPL